MAKAKTKKAAEKLTPIPKHVPRGRHAASDGQLAAAPPAGNDLSHIAAGLHALAVPIGELQFDPANACLHPEGNVEALKGSLAAYGQCKPVVVRRDNGVVVAGNGTLKAALALGWQHLAAVYVDMDAATAAGFSIADNRTSDLAAWDKEALDKLLREVSTKNDERLDAMLAELAKEQGLYLTEDGGNDAPDPGADLDRAAELQAKWGTQPGQLWLIPSKATPGKAHRLLCGDSTKPEDVARVMGGEKARLMATDPPYGIAYTNEDLHPNAGPVRGKVTNDELTGEKLQQFLESAFRPAIDLALAPKAPWYLWHAHLTQGFFAAAAASAANVVLHRQIIWVKPVLVFGRGQYHWKHEPCFVGWVKGQQPPDYGLGNGERTQTTVWEVDGVSHADRKEFYHSTPKPVGLFTVPIVKHLNAGEIAYEPFAGSGPQFVAAEQTGRLCYGTDCEPANVAVILERLAGMGLEPRLDGTEPAVPADETGAPSPPVKAAKRKGRKAA